MDPEGGKIKFGFSKIIKKPNIINQNGESANKAKKIEMIEEIEGSSIKIFGKDKNDDVEKKLIIPMTNDQKTTPLSKLLERKLRKIKVEPEVKMDTEEAAAVTVKQEPPIDETLEQQAARELIEDLKNKTVKTEVKVFEVPINPDELPLEGAKESSLDDYDRVPIGDFGKAMLRGMGWKDEEKEDLKKAELEGPILRPKGMGLGADKVIKKQPLLIPPNQSETLEIKRNACVKVLAGKHKNLYGTIEGFDDGGGRVIVKLAIGGLKVTLNEFMVQPISKQEFAKYGKILNSEKYEEYKSGAPVKNESLVKEVREKSPKRERSIEKNRKLTRDSSSSRDRRDHQKSRDRGREADRYKSSRKHHERSRSREKRPRKNSSSSDDHKRKKKSSKHKKNYSSPDSRYSSENEKRHKKKSKKSKRGRDRS